MAQKYLALCFIRDLMLEMTKNAEKIVRVSLLDRLTEIACLAQGKNWNQISEIMFPFSRDQDKVFGLRFYLLLVECLRDWGEKLIPTNTDGSNSPFKVNWNRIKGMILVPRKSYFYDAPPDCLAEKDALFRYTEFGTLSAPVQIGGRSVKSGVGKSLVSKTESLTDKPQRIQEDESFQIGTQDSRTHLTQEQLDRSWRNNSQILERLRAEKNHTLESILALEGVLQSLDQMIIERQILFREVFQRNMVIENLQRAQSKFAEVTMSNYDKVPFLVNFRSPLLRMQKEKAVREVELANGIIDCFELFWRSRKDMESVNKYRKDLIEKMDRILGTHPPVFDHRLLEENQRIFSTNRELEEFLSPSKTVQEKKPFFDFYATELKNKTSADYVGDERKNVTESIPFEIFSEKQENSNNRSFQFPVMARREEYGDTTPSSLNRRDTVVSNSVPSQKSIQRKGSATLIFPKKDEVRRNDRQESFQQINPSSAKAFLQVRTSHSITVPQENDDDSEPINNRNITFQSSSQTRTLVRENSLPIYQKQKNEQTSNSNYEKIKQEFSEDVNQIQDFESNPYKLNIFINNGNRKNQPEELNNRNSFKQKGDSENIKKSSLSKPKFPIRETNFALKLRQKETYASGDSDFEFNDFSPKDISKFSNKKILDRKIDRNDSKNSLNSYQPQKEFVSRNRKYYDDEIDPETFSDFYDLKPFGKKDIFKDTDSRIALTNNTIRKKVDKLRGSLGKTIDSSSISHRDLDWSISNNASGPSEYYDKKSNTIFIDQDVSTESLKREFKETVSQMTKKVEQVFHTYSRNHDVKKSLRNKNAYD